MYKKIRSHPTTQEIYAKRLTGEGVLTEGEVEKMRADWRARLDAEQEASQGYKANSADWLDGRWSGMKSARDADDPRRGNTGVAAETLHDIGRKITATPQGFHVHRTIQRFLDARLKAIETGQASTGRPPKPWRSARCSRKAIRCDCPARTASAAPSRSGIRC